MTVPPPVPCRSASCGQLVDFAVPDQPKAGGGVRLPVNHDSAGDPAGNLEVWRDERGILRYRYLKKGEDPAPGRHRGVAHFATCAEPDAWRRGGAG